MGEEKDATGTKMTQEKRKELHATAMESGGMGGFVFTC